ncbi:putative galacturonosyltransferase 14 [Hordeum vulgare]|nr:putative galacturonosyltransferase 14 [Hordeum vulgare]
MRLSSLCTCWTTTTVNIDQAPLNNYGYNEFDGDMHGHNTEEDGMEEVDKAVFDQEQAKNRKRSKNYTYLKDQILIKAWKVVSLDAAIDTNQIAKRYWQRIEDQFIRLMAKYPNRTRHTFRSLQGGLDVIKPFCSCWAACLEQVRNPPPSGQIAQERYKHMKASCGMSSNLEYCWKLLQHSQKWELIDKNSPPKRGSLTEMDDDVDEDDNGPRNKNKSNENKKAKDNIKRGSKASSFCDKIDIMVQSNEVLVIQTLEEKDLAEKKVQEKYEKWILLKEEGLRKATIDERKALAEENKVLAKLLAVENKVITMTRN